MSQCWAGMVLNLSRYHPVGFKFKESVMDIGFGLSFSSVCFPSERIAILWLKYGIHKFRERLFTLMSLFL